jgi:hypothetical protein
MKDEKFIYNFGEGKRQLGRPRRRGRDIIIDLRKLRWKSVD